MSGKSTSPSCRSSYSKQIRSLNTFPTEQELSEIIADANTEDGRLITFAEVICIYAKYFNKSVNHEQELVNAFKVFDKSKDGLINSEELMHHLTRMGERFTEEQILQINPIFESNANDQSMVDYKLMSKMILRTDRSDL